MINVSLRYRPYEVTIPLGWASEGDRAPQFRQRILLFLRCHLTAPHGSGQSRVMWWRSAEFPPFPGLCVVDQFPHIFRLSADRIQFKFGQPTHYAAHPQPGWLLVMLWFHPQRGLASTNALIVRKRVRWNGNVVIWTKPLLTEERKDEGYTLLAFCKGQPPGVFPCHGVTNLYKIMTRSKYRGITFIAGTQYICSFIHKYV